MEFSAMTEATIETTGAMTKTIRMITTVTTTATTMTTEREGRVVG
jgi:hypothetical protein